jgi:hypothetical protein
MNQIPFVPAPYDPYYLAMRSEQKHKVLIAIMDTGVDPGAFGLTSCPDGSPKVIDVIDCTGADDVIVKNVKPIEIFKYSGYIREVIETKYQIKNQISDDDFINMYCKVYKGIRSFKSFVSVRQSKDNFTDEQKKILEELIFNVIVLKFLDDNSSLCIIDYDGSESNYILLDEYHLRQKYGSIPFGKSSTESTTKSTTKSTTESTTNPNTSFNFGFHIYPGLSDDQMICSLVFDTGGHATHVAGIIGGNFPDPQMNGINPHAQILSLKIGDSRINGMETSIALIRALQEIVKHDCHIVNYSYGEPVGSNINGKFIEMLNEYIYKHNITFITSAGNSGPMITSIGAPATLTDRTISIGAYVSTDYQSKLYHLTQSVFESGLTHWSARGPGMNDSMGVDCLAPGCALTSHPRWHKSCIKMCNGTSMAAPNATGFMSLILSQFESSDSYPHTYWLKQYLILTSEYIGDFEIFAQGHGLIGQKIIKINDWFSKPSNYYYDISINNNQSKKGFVKFIESKESTGSKESAESIESNDTTYFTFNIQMNELPGKYGKGFDKINTFKKLHTNACNHIKHTIVLPETIMVHPSTSHIRCGLNNQMISGYILLTESDTDRIVKHIPINQFVCKKFRLNDPPCVIKTKLIPGKTISKYLIPQYNTLNINFKSQIKQTIFVDIIQSYSGHGYDDRSDYKTFSSDSTQESMDFTWNIIPYVPTEILVYTPWSSPESEEITIKIKGLTKSMSLNKHIFEIGEPIFLKLDKYLNKTNESSFKDNVDITNIITKYHPITAEFIDVDTRYVDKDAKPLKLLRLKYSVESHINASYSINTNNRIYDSSVCMSGSLNGFKNNRRVFYANYIPKKVDSDVDTVYVEFMDSNMDDLKECLTTILTVNRVFDEPIKRIFNFSKGMNIINILGKDLHNIKGLYSGDLIQCSVLSEQFTIIYNKPILIQEKLSDQITQNTCINDLMKNFDYVKHFLNKILAYPLYPDFKFNHDINILDVIETAVNITSIDSNLDKDILKKYMNLNIDQRNAYEYIGTLMFEVDKSYTELSSENNFVKCVKRTFEHLNQQKLCEIAPYQIIQLACMIIDKKPENINTVIQKITEIKKNIKWWANGSDNDLDKLKYYWIDNMDRFILINTNKQISCIDEAKLVGLKRKRELEESSSEIVIYS